MNKITLITIGDIDGIGIELLIKLWKKGKINNFIILTNVSIFRNYLNKKKIKIEIEKINNFNKKLILSKKKLYIYDYVAKNKIENTYLSLLHSYKLASKFQFNGIITLPLNKSKIIKHIDNKFIGQTELFQKLDKKNFSNMIFYSKQIIILSLTTHIAINKINLFLEKKDLIYKKIISLNNTLINDFNIKKPKIVLAGLNPHAGEDGNIGSEEEKIFKPMIKKLKNKKIFIEGPYSADTLFNNENIKKYDCFICSYHDQALIPFKIISQNKGINYTGSLNIIRISPDHGTAISLVGKNLANPDSLLYSFKVIKKINRNRSKIVKV